ncbi:hypothetical protein ACT4MK_03140 [Bradyrhizobium barranii]|uniref:hypothetical protein n=1 Tax=Bradyrhizobium TaxID=374 RepID=UPI003F227147
MNRSIYHVSQILTVTSALAIHACIADLLTEPTVVTGYSVGEMAAWSIAGIWTADEALRLTDVRAQLMDRVAGADDRLGMSAASIRPRSTPCSKHIAARSRSGIPIVLS